MKKLFTLSLAFLILAILPQVVAAQVNSSSGEVKMESKHSKKEAKKIKKEEKKAKKKAKKMTDSETQVPAVNEGQAVSEEKVAKEEKEVKTKKNEPRPYVGKKIEQPKKEPKTHQKVNKPEDH